MRAIKLTELPGYAHTQTTPTCVRPTGLTGKMCGRPAAHVGVRADGWVTGTTWCADDVAADASTWAGFAWHPLDLDVVEVFVHQLTADTAADTGPADTRDQVDAFAGQLADSAALLSRLVRDRDDARRQRDQLAEQLADALDQRDQARAALAAAGPVFYARHMADQADDAAGRVRAADAWRDTVPAAATGSTPPATLAIRSGAARI